MRGSVFSLFSETMGGVARFRGGLVFKAHRRLYHSTLGSRVIKKKKLRVTRWGVGGEEFEEEQKELGRFGRALREARQRTRPAPLPVPNVVMWQWLTVEGLGR